MKIETVPFLFTKVVSLPRKVSGTGQTLSTYLLNEWMNQWLIKWTDCLSRHILVVTAFSSIAQSCSTLCNPMNCSTPGLPVHHQLRSLRLTSIESVMPSSHLILCRPLLLLPPILPSIRIFCNKSTLRMRWPKYWSFSFSISPYNEYSRLISFRIDWLGLLAVQGTLKSLLQHRSSKASILQCSAFFTVSLHKILGASLGTHR